ncbi:hypothetical protein [Aeromonas veronii]|uniref:hypothetical protein n=1 Tax=Aeromonas veronii TaxID=654 RepID=UPI0022462EB9|nr:hypothetical protein [Aeromonas veronii]MCX0437094.1 hypothetical protein [Aeromonas veronii]
MDNLLDIANEAVKNKFKGSAPVEKKAESDKKSPHLAICLDKNPSANNRHKSLMLKSNAVGLVDLVKSDSQSMEFEAFCETLQNPLVLLDLFTFCKSSGHDDFIQSVIKNSKQ